MALKLSLSVLSDLPTSVAQPSYSRSDLSAGILHIGVGNFHRAHQAVYLDRLFDLGRDLDWAIVGAGIKPFDAARRNVLKGQDWLTTVVELSPHAPAARVTGAMIDFLEVDAEAIIDRLADPAIRIVSLTLTEGGYFVDAASGGFNDKASEIVADAGSPDQPGTVFGILIRALDERRKQGMLPFTVMSCDNLPENGHVARQALIGLARMIDCDLAAWIGREVAFPSGMVDCITPATSQAEIEMVRDAYGLDDAAPVTCEPFRQWVLEDHFPAGRPGLEHVGVQFVSDVRPYELMKLRILNAGHAAIAYIGALLGHRNVHDAMLDPDIDAWLRRLMQREVIPVLPEIPGVDYRVYLDLCIERFSNPRINDTIARLCADGSNRQPKFILPTVRDALAAGRPVDLLALEVAMWCRYCWVSSQEGNALSLADERAARLVEAARVAHQDPAAFLSLREIFGDLGGSDEFASAFRAHVDHLWSLPERQALRDCLKALA